MRYNSRVGRFRIPGEVCVMLQQDPDMQSEFIRSLMGLFAQMIIIRASDCPYAHGIDYWALSPLFESVEEGQIVPWYAIEFQTIDHGEDYQEQGQHHRMETIATAVKRKPPEESW